MAVGGTLTQVDKNGAERVIAFFSKKLSDTEQRYTANERELLGLVYFLKRFRCYLEGSSFEIFTDNQVLKHFFTKPVMSRKEARWPDLLAQFGITNITLKPGRVHVLGDVLSRAPHVMNEQLSLDNLSLSSPSLQYGFAEHYDGDQMFGPFFRALKGQFPSDPIKKNRVQRLLHLFTFSESTETLRYQSKICVPRRCIRDRLFQAHDTRVAGHFASAKTVSRLEQFHWKGKTRDVRRYCEGCLTCQQQKKYNSRKKYTEPTALPVPSRRWGSIATDFIVKLPKTKNGYDSITTWVDRLSRRVHFIPSRTTDTAVDVAEAFFTNIFPLHGSPDNIVSDRDPKFTSKFWSNLLSLCGVKANMSLSHHPQTDGISEVMNRMIENYLRCYCSYRQDDWDTLLPAAEFAYNSATSPDLGSSPFEIDLGWQSVSPLERFRSSPPTAFETLEEFRSTLRNALEDARFCHHLSKAKNSAYSAEKYQPHPYKIGDRAWLDRSLFRDAVAQAQPSEKRSARRFGPFRITELIGKNALRLELPSNIKLHPVVNAAHTTLFKQQPIDIAPSISPQPVPVPDTDGSLLYEVDQILKHRRRGRGYQFLTLMKGAPTHEAEWQPTREFVDQDGTLTKAFLDYITEHDLLPQLRES